jgi:chromosome segregation ATPase
MHEKLVETERLRNGALQEAAYYRAQATALESGSPSDASRLERERIVALEAKLAQLSADHTARDRKLSEMQQTVVTESRLREQAELRAAEAVKRADILEMSHDNMTRDYESLHREHGSAQTALRDHSDHLISQTSRAEQAEAESAAVRTQLETLSMQQLQHKRFLEQTQVALDASSSRVYEMEHQLQKTTQRIGDLETELLDARAELEARSVEAATATARLADVENAWAKSREEADSLRALTTQGLGELLDSHRDLQADEDRATLGHAEKVQALEAEAASLRKALSETHQRADDAQVHLVDHRTRLRDLEGTHTSLQGQLINLRNKLSQAVAENGDLKQQVSSSERQLAETRELSSKAELKHAILRNYLANHNLLVDEEDLANSPTDGPNRVIELQSLLNQSTRDHEDTHQELELLRSRYKDVVEQVAQLSSDLERTRSDVDGTKGLANEGSRDQVLELQRALSEAEQSHQERMRQLENDYHTAVHYVK